MTTPTGTASGGTTRTVTATVGNTAKQAGFPTPSPVSSATSCIAVHDLEGWVLYANIKAAGAMSISPERLGHIIQNNHRFETRGRGSELQLRATQGLSGNVVATEQVARRLEAAECPELLAHGTRMHYLENILLEGLLPGGLDATSRQDVHMVRADRAGYAKRDPRGLQGLRPNSNLVVYTRAKDLLRPPGQGGLCVNFRGDVYLAPRVPRTALVGFLDYRGTWMGPDDVIPAPWQNLIDEILGRPRNWPSLRERSDTVKEPDREPSESSPGRSLIHI